jgi:hypothetical protein
MKTDPQVPGTAGAGGVSGAVKTERDGNDLHNIIERVVVKTCFKGGVAGSGSRDAVPQSSPLHPSPPPSTGPVIHARTRVSP